MENGMEVGVVFFISGFCGIHLRGSESMFLTQPAKAGPHDYQTFL